MTAGIQLRRRRVSLDSSVSPSKSCMAGVSENRARCFRQLTLRTARGDCSLASDTAAINTPHRLQSKKSQVRVPNRQNRTRSQSFAATLSSPTGSDIIRGLWLQQNEQVHARTAKSSGALERWIRTCTLPQ